MKNLANLRVLEIAHNRLAVSSGGNCNENMAPE